MDVAYAELHCLTNFTFLRGASHPEELIKRALALGYSGLAITDECSFAGSARAHLALRELREIDAAAREFRLIHGTELRLTEARGPFGEGGPRLVLLAQNRAGYGNLAQLVTLGRRKAVKGSYRLSRSDLEQHAGWLEDTLALLLADEGQDDILEQARWLQQLMPGRSWLTCELLHIGDDAAHLAQLADVAEQTGMPLVAGGDVHMHARQRKPLADVLAAIREKTPLTVAGNRLATNAERYLRPLYRLARIYPTPLLLETLAIAARCTFSLDEIRYEYPEELVPAGRDAGHASAQAHLRRCVRGATPRARPHGCAWRSSTSSHSSAELRYEPFFLTVHDIVRFARAQDDPLPGARLGRQLGGLLLPGHHRGRSRPHVAALRALHLARSATSRPTSTSTSSTSGARR